MNPYAISWMIGAAAAPVTAYVLFQKLRHPTRPVTDGKHAWPRHRLRSFIEPDSDRQ